MLASHIPTTLSCMNLSLRHVVGWNGGPHPNKAPRWFDTPISKMSCFAGKPIKNGACCLTNGLFDLRLESLQEERQHGNEFISNDRQVNLNSFFLGICNKQLRIHIDR